MDPAAFGLFSGPKELEYCRRYYEGAALALLQKRRDLQMPGRPFLCRCWWRAKTTGAHDFHEPVLGWICASRRGWWLWLICEAVFKAFRYFEVRHTDSDQDFLVYR